MKEEEKIIPTPLKKKKTRRKRVIVVLAVIFQTFHRKKNLLNLVIHSSQANMEKLEELGMKKEVTSTGAGDGKCFAIS